MPFSRTVFRYDSLFWATGKDEAPHEAKKRLRSEAGLVDLAADRARGGEELGVAKVVGGGRCGCGGEEKWKAAATPRPPPRPRDGPIPTMPPAEGGSPGKAGGPLRGPLRQSPRFELLQTGFARSQVVVAESASRPTSDDQRWNCTRRQFVRRQSKGAAGPLEAQVHRPISQDQPCVDLRRGPIRFRPRVSPPPRDEEEDGEAFFRNSSPRPPHVRPSRPRSLDARGRVHQMPWRRTRNGAGWRGRALASEVRRRAPFRTQLGPFFLRAEPPARPYGRPAKQEADVRN